MRRLINAARNSARAWHVLIRSEPAIQLESILIVVALPVAWIISPSWRGWGLLMASLLVLLIVEVLNTGIEAACDAFSREFNTDIRLAKDCGSLAVAISALLAVGVWGMAVWEWLSGAPI